MSAELEAAQRIAAYVVAREAFGSAEVAATEVQELLTWAARAVGKTNDPGRPRSFNASNPNAEINAIPSPADALAVMGRWADARTAVRDAWAKLLPEERRHVQPLPRDAGPEPLHR